MDSKNDSRPQRFLSGNQVAQLIGVCPTTVGKHIKSGLLRPDATVANLLLFKPERIGELAALLDRNRQANWRHIPHNQK